MANIYENGSYTSMEYGYSKIYFYFVSRLNFLVTNTIIRNLYKNIIFFTGRKNQIVKRKRKKVKGNYKNTPVNT